MSEQADKLNRVLREKGIPIPEAPKNSEGVSGWQDERELPLLELPREGKRRLVDFAREAGAICKDVGMLRREVVPITINMEKSSFEAMETDRFRSYLENIAYTFKWKRIGEEFQKVTDDVPVELSRGTLRSDQFVFQLPRLQRINMVRQPVLRRDGRLEILPEGYDAESEVFTMPNNIVIDESWSLDRSCMFLRDLLKDFAIDDRSRAVQIASMASFFGSGLQEISAKRLNFVMSSNSPGGGKGLLVEMAIVPVMGSCDVQTIPKSADAFRETLNSAVLNAIPYVFFDELEGNIKNNDLNAFITSSSRTGRLFNNQKMFSCPKTTICYLAGNNLTLSTDIARRVLECKIYIEEADNRHRKFDRELTADYFKRPEVRGDVLSALWCLIRSWDQAGRPGVDKVLPSFEEWSRIFGGIVQHAGFGNPTVPPPSEESGDTEWSDMVLLVSKLSDGVGGAWVGEFPPEKKKDYSFDRVMKVCLDNNCFSWIIPRNERTVDGVIEYEYSPKAASIMGKLLSDKYGGRVFRMPDGRRIRFGKRGKNRQRRYEVTAIEE
jgi:hypothetical protein